MIAAGRGIPKKTYKIFVDGVRHIAAGRLAADHGLVRDYVARLCRQGKVRGRQFGTHWYIDEASFKNFLVLREYEHAARRQKLAVDRQREYRIAQTVAAKSRPPVTSEKSASRCNVPSAVEESGLSFRLHRLRIHIRLDRAKPSN